MIPVLALSPYELEWQRQPPKQPREPNPSGSLLPMEECEVGSSLALPEMSVLALDNRIETWLKGFGKIESFVCRLLAVRFLDVESPNN